VRLSKKILAYDFFVLGAFLLLALTGFPVPHVDDPYFAGTASWLARGHGLINPWLADWLVFYGTEELFQHIPFYFYILAGWYKLAGISTASTLLFYALINALAAMAAARVLRRMGFPEGVVWFHLLWMTFFAQGSGFRGDMVAVALFWLGLALMFEARRSFNVLGIVVLQVAVATWLPVLPFAAAFFVGWVFQKKKASPRFSDWNPLLITCGVTGLVVVLLIHLMIDGRWHEFMDQYIKHMASRRLPLWMVLPAFVGLAVSRYSWLFIFSLVLSSTVLFIRARHRKKAVIDSTLLWFLLAASASLGLAILYPFAIALAFYLLPVFCFSCLWVDGNKYGKEDWLLAVVLTFLALPQVYQYVSDWVAPPVSVSANIRDSADALAAEGKRLVFDEYAYRYVFDMMPDETSRAWFYLEPGMFAPDLSHWQEGDVWVVSEPYLCGGFAKVRGAQMVIYPEPDGQHLRPE
jgi:hypothetical protein